MSYGGWLDRALVSLEAAGAAFETADVVEHPSAVAALAARRMVHAEVERLRQLVVGSDEEAVRAFRQSPAELQALFVAGRRGRPADANRLLRTVSSIAAQGESRRWPPPRTRDPFAQDLMAAASALRTAGDVLSSHIEPAGMPRSQVGAAIRRGAGVAGALGDLCRVSAVACRADRQLHRWLTDRSDDGGVLREVHGAELVSIAMLADAAVPAQLDHMAKVAPPSALRHLQIAAPSDVSAHSVMKIRDVLAVVQAVAADMFQHPESVTMVHIADACKLGARLAEVAADVGRTTRAPETVAQARETAEAWHEAVRMAAALGAQPATGYPMRARIAAAARLLGELSGQTIRGTQAELVHTAAACLPDLTAGMLSAIKYGIGHGLLLGYRLDLARNGPGLVHRTVPRWEVMTELDGPVALLCHRLYALASDGRRHIGEGKAAGSVTAIAGQLDKVRSSRVAHPARLRGQGPPVPTASPDRLQGRSR